MIAIIMGSGDWSDQTVEEIRHTFGNALVKKMYKDFSYKKVLCRDFWFLAFFDCGVDIIFDI